MGKRYRDRLEWERTGWGGRMKWGGRRRRRRIVWRIRRGGGGGGGGEWLERKTRGTTKKGRWRRSQRQMIREMQQEKETDKENGKGDGRGVYWWLNGWLNRGCYQNSVKRMKRMTIRRMATQQTIARWTVVYTRYYVISMAFMDHVSSDFNIIHSSMYGLRMRSFCETLRCSNA